LSWVLARIPRDESRTLNEHVPALLVRAIKKTAQIYTRKRGMRWRFLHTVETSSCGPTREEAPEASSETSCPAVGALIHAIWKKTTLAAKQVKPETMSNVLML
jgi:hypothetical protein